MKRSGDRTGIRSAGRWVFACVLAGVLAAGCATTQKDRRAQGLDAAANSYQAALRWGDYAAAMAMLSPDRHLADELPDAFLDLRITRYEIVRPPVIHTDDRATQTAAIEYVYEYNQVVQRLTDRQEWHWDDASKNWWLASGLPDFAPGGSRSGGR
ncbi:hypothetical protein [Thioalkalivibrio paradoxus]|uniref:Lipoprotein n=1 Tax=Thioalkalivibrio paradoxus ARh 1 TaxID=713585 RepID=W0DL37_9GAMM|nr:hypothetical protein [Thioalkalivibrio paradoxus]AHE97972.1 hypothetical protein THITH_06555 [Thioalkalivibrio paradoxus ARh 1]